MRGVSQYREDNNISSVSGLLVHPAALVFPSDGFPQFLVADQHDGEGQTRQPPDGAGRGGQLQTLGQKYF